MHRFVYSSYVASSLWSLLLTSMFQIVFCYAWTGLNQAELLPQSPSSAPSCTLKIHNKGGTDQVRCIVLRLKRFDSAP